ncbi:MAG TPA: DUF2169 domain-containing protein [Nitrospirae bacterium]|nr:DUF2169 domain-containing protein [Nitrospirota bacterium]
MWALTNNTPFKAERTWVRDKNGAEVWLVAVKGAFSIAPDGSIQLAEEQEEVNIAPKFRGDPQSASLLYDTDLPHTKKNTDILIEGHAYAPHGQPVTKVDVTLKVADIKKTLRVIGDRMWQKSLLGVSLSRPQPFVKIPLTYERAFGGTDQTSKNPKHHGWEPRNPVGRGFATKADHLIGKPAPNIEDTSSLIGNWKLKSYPAGFGPIAGNWSPRVELAGTYDKNWEKTRQPLLAEDFNESYYQCAPKDQQAKGYLKGEELFELYNMTPAGVLKFRLPRISIGFTTHFDDNTTEEHRAVLHTVIVKPDLPKVVMVWHTNLECHHKVLKLLNTTIRVKRRILQSEEEKPSNAWQLV